MLLQILDDGRLTDSQGRTVNFKNTIVIMTSNLGSSVLLEGIDASGRLKEGVRDEVMQRLRSHFRPEFLNRVDDVVLFKPLALEEIERIVTLLVSDLAERLGEQELSIDVAHEACEFIAREGFDPVYGARPLKRFLQQEVETPIARMIVSGAVVPGAVLRVGVKDGALQIR